jgi:hypothetical protein
VTAAARGCGVLQETGARRQQIEQQWHAGPFAGPTPESMMVPEGASESARAGAQIPSKLVMRVQLLLLVSTAHCRFAT